MRRNREKKVKIKHALTFSLSLFVSLVSNRRGRKGSRSGEGGIYSFRGGIFCCAGFLSYAVFAGSTFFEEQKLNFRKIDCRRDGGRDRAALALALGPERGRLLGRECRTNSTALSSSMTRGCRTMKYSAYL